MTLRQGLLALACAAALGSPAQALAQAQAATNYEVRRGDSLFAVARKSKYDNVSRNQMILALWRANQDAFPGGNINLLEVGTILVIPSREAASGVEPAEADRLVREMLSKAQAPQVQVAVVKPTPPAAATAASKPGASQIPTGEDWARRYRDGLALERRGDEQGAFKAFLQAGEGGYGLAQRKLGQLYDKGNTVVQRDYQESLRWYQRARDQGVAIDKPIQRMTTK